VAIPTMAFLQKNKSTIYQSKTKKNVGFWKAGGACQAVVFITQLFHLRNGSAQTSSELYVPMQLMNYDNLKVRVLPNTFLVSCSSGSE
jgi:hypothetical protein